MIRKEFVIALLVLAALVVALFLPLPPQRVVRTELSPNGELTATYSWKPLGLLGLITQDNPWLYLTVRDNKSGAIILSRSTWGDGPDDDRLAEDVPWRQR